MDIRRCPMRLTAEVEFVGESRLAVAVPDMIAAGSYREGVADRQTRYGMAEDRRRSDMRDNHPRMGRRRENAAIVVAVRLKAEDCRRDRIATDGQNRSRCLIGRQVNATGRRAKRNLAHLARPHAGTRKAEVGPIG